MPEIPRQSDLDTHHDVLFTFLGEAVEQQEHAEQRERDAQQERLEKILREIPAKPTEVRPDMGLDKQKLLDALPRWSITAAVRAAVERAVDHFEETGAELSQAAGNVAATARGIMKSLKKGEMPKRTAPKPTDFYRSNLQIEGMEPIIAMDTSMAAVAPTALVSSATAGETVTTQVTDITSLQKNWATFSAQKQTALLGVIKAVQEKTLTTTEDLLAAGRTAGFDLTPVASSLMADPERNYLQLRTGQLMARETDPQVLMQDRYLNKVLEMGDRQFSSSSNTFTIPSTGTRFTVTVAQGNVWLHNGMPRRENTGAAAITITFPDGPQYVSSIFVESASGGGGFTIYFANGTTKVIDATTALRAVPVNGVVTKIISTGPNKLGGIDFGMSKQDLQALEAKLPAVSAYTKTVPAPAPTVAPAVAIDAALAKTVSSTATVLSAPVLTAKQTMEQQGLKPALSIVPEGKNLKIRFRTPSEAAQVVLYQNSNSKGSPIITSVKTTHSGGTLASDVVLTNTYGAEDWTMVRLLDANGAVQDEVLVYFTNGQFTKTNNPQPVIAPPVVTTGAVEKPASATTSTTVAAVDKATTAPAAEANETIVAPPVFEVVGQQGNHILVHVRLPITENTTVGFAMEGPLANRVFTMPANTTTHQLDAIVPLSLPGGTKTGPLTVRVFNKSASANLMELPLHWDGTNLTTPDATRRAAPEVVANAADALNDLYTLRRLAVSDAHILQVNGMHAFERSPWAAQLEDISQRRMEFLRQQFPQVFLTQQEWQAWETNFPATYTGPQASMTDERARQRNALLDKARELSKGFDNWLGREWQRIASLLGEATNRMAGSIDGTRSFAADKASWANAAFQIEQHVGFEYRNMRIVDAPVSMPSTEAIWREALRQVDLDPNVLLWGARSQYALEVAETNARVKAEIAAVQDALEATARKLISPEAYFHNLEVIEQGTPDPVQRSAKIWNYRIQYAEAWVVYEGVTLPSGFTAKQYAMDLQARDKAIVVAAKDVLFAYSGSTGLSIDGIQFTNAGPDVGGESGISAAQRESALKSMYSPAMNGLVSLPVGMKVDTTTLMGRLFVGLLQQSEGPQRADAMAKFAAITGIKDVSRITDALKPFLMTERAQKLHDVLINDGTYRGIFTPAFIADGTHVNNPTVGLKDGKTEYTSTDSSIRVRFDLAIPAGQNFHHGNVYLCDANSNQMSDLQLIDNNFTSQLFADVPMSSIIAALKKQLYTLDTSKPFVGTFKVALWDANGQSIQGQRLTTGTFTITFKGGLDSINYSNKEAAIYSELANHFPLQNPSQWHVDLASTAHTGSGFFALDLNMNTQDKGQPVSAPLRGEVVVAGTGTYNTFILKHESLVNGEKIVWYTKYLHMDTIGKRDANRNVIALKIGDILEQGEIFGLVSDVGAPGENHLHLEVNFTGAGGQSIDVVPLINKLGLKVQGTAYTIQNGVLNQNGARQEIFWNNELQTWITGTNGIIGGNYLIYDRRAQQTTDNGGSYWLAYEKGKTIDQMDRVVWDTGSNTWRKWDIVKNDWALVNGKKQIWNGTSFTDA